ncbi:DNA replication/repair protein RecF [Thermaurantiacus sp.]
MAHPALLSLALADFRNHAATRMDTGGAAVILLAGPNGAGKTALLEAVSLFAVGRGLRGATLADMARSSGSGGFRIRTTLAPEPALPPISLETFTLPEAPERRLLRAEGAAAPLARLSEWLSILWLTPLMDRLFLEGAAARRRFLDRLAHALHPGHAGHATRYEAALRQRNRLLAAPEPPDPAWLQALEAQMGAHGRALAAARADTVSRLAARLAAEAGADFPRALLTPPPRHDDLALALAASRAADRAAGRTRTGPHLDDLEVRLAATGLPAAHASTGEQKALLLGILLAQAGLVADTRGMPPLLLLDEAIAHLDPDRREALFSRIARLGGQAWLSGTDMAPFAGLEAARFEVRNGQVRPA